MSFRVLPIATNNGAGDQIVYPFSVLKTTTNDGGSSILKITVTPGVVNNIVPNNMFDSFSATIQGDFYVKLTINTDGQKISTVSIKVGTDYPITQQPTPFALPSYFEILLAIIHNGAIFRTIGNGSIFTAGTQTYITTVDNPQAGVLPYTPYFVWDLSNTNVTV